MSALPITLRRETDAVRTTVVVPRPVSRSVVTPAADSVARRSDAARLSLRDYAKSGRAGAESPAQRRDQLVQALLARVPAGDRSAARTAIPAILDAARKLGSSDPNQLGYLLATAQTESDFGTTMVETGHSKQWFEQNYGGEDGNRPGTDDGYAYRGRGYVQTTHAGRYAELSHRLGLPDVPVGQCASHSTRAGVRREPELVAEPNRLTEPTLAAAALVVGVQENLFTHNAAAAIDKTIPAGKAPGKADFYHARAIVNGIVRTQALTIAAHATAYAHVLADYRSVLDAPTAK